MIIYLVTTGGTIEKVYSKQEGTVLNTESKVERYLKQLRLPGCELRVIPVMNKDSLEMMTEPDRRRLAAELTSLLPNGHPVIVIHRTDTMVETGLYIHKLFERHLKVPVILTGTMTPLGFEGSDGLQNLTEKLAGGAAAAFRSLHRLPWSCPSHFKRPEGSPRSHLRLSSQQDSARESVGQSRAAALFSPSVTKNSYSSFLKSYWTANLRLMQG